MEKRLNKVLVLLAFFFGLVGGASPVAGPAYAQLVPNPSFETYSACPTSSSGSGQLAYATGWTSPTLSSSDYYNTCGNAAMGVPLNAVGYQTPHGPGHGYAGLYVYCQDPIECANMGPDYREYLESALTSPLVAGHTYQVTFYVSLAENSGQSSDGMGAYFSHGAVGSTSRTVLNYSPQIHNPNGMLMTDTSNWIPVSGSFVAAGGEDHITIGNFKNNASTLYGHTVRYDPGIHDEATTWSYYYVDDIVISDVTGTLKVCKVAGNGVTVGTMFNFDISPFGSAASTLSVPAGPPPGGSCAVGPGFPFGTVVGVAEEKPGGSASTGWVTAISASPAARLLGSNLNQNSWQTTQGSATVNIGPGVTEVTFTNTNPNVRPGPVSPPATNVNGGYLEVCKVGLGYLGRIHAMSSFTVSGVSGTISVAAGSCSAPLNVTPGNVVITELPPMSNFWWTVAPGCCATFPADRQVSHDDANRTSTVLVTAGDISTETIAYITNMSPVPGPRPGSQPVAVAKKP